MNILTKICVVVLVVTSIVASVVFINLATVSPNWRDAYNREADAYKVLAAKYRGFAEVSETLSKDRNDLRKALDAQKTKALADIAELNEDKNKLEITIADLNRQLALKANITPDSGKATTEYLYKQQKELRDAWETEAKTRLKLVEVESQLLSEQAKNKRLENSLRVIKEKAQSQTTMIVKLNERISELEVLEGKKTVVDTAVPVPATKISGTVTGVNDNLASVNVGSAQGLKAGMQLIVCRGDQFVGHLKIEEVGVNEAAGIIVNRRLAPLQGDKVISSLSD